MLVTYFTHISRTMLTLMVLALFAITKIDAQVSYRCFCDDSYPDGVLGFEITAFGSGPGEVWTVDNVINLYSSINPTIVINNGTQLVQDPINTNEYTLSGFALNGVMPFVTVLDGSGGVNNVNMMTCVIPEGEIIGDDNICVGATASLEFDVSTMNILPGSTVWEAPGSVSAVPGGSDNLMLEVEYDMPGSYIVNVSARSSTNCEISDDFIINVFDAAEGIEISGPDYLCFDNANGVMYTATNPNMYGLIWTGSGTGGDAVFMPFLGTPLTGSGTSVSVDFPATGTYVLEIQNADPMGCPINNVEYVVEVVDALDTIQIIGETYACEGNTELYTIANAINYSNLEWTINPTTDVIMTPADGLADEISIEYFAAGDYVLSLTGTSPDGCPIVASLDITVPTDSIPSMACNNSVNVSLNNSCVLELLPDMILEGEINENDAYEIIIEDAVTGEILPGNMVTQDQLGNTFKVTVIEKCAGNSCWGNLVVEDKSVTPLDQFCSDAPIVTTCYEFGATPESPLGFPDFPIDASWTYNSNTGKWLVSGFDNCSDALLSFEDDVLTSDVCADPQVILRTWTAVDINNGLFTTCQVTIQLALTDKNSIVWPPDYDSTLDMDPIGGVDTDGILPSLDPCNFTPHDLLLCGDYWIADEEGNPSPDCTGAPVSVGFACPNLQLIGYTDRVLDVCGSSRKILRQWTVWDACDLTDIMHTQIITLMDTIAPICQPPVETQVTTDIHECGGDIVVAPPVVSGECDEYSYTIKYKLNDQFGFNPLHFRDDNIVYDKDLERYVIQDIEFDTDSIWVQYIVRDACGNKANDCFGEFELIDDEQPVPACDFNNVVTLNQFGEAWVGPSTFDDNSWDNCGIYTHVIRRMEDKCECAEPRFDFLHSLGEYNGHYYFLSKERMHAGKAFGLASALDAYVVRIDSVQENNWVRDRVDEYTDDDYYIGLSGVSTSALYWQSGSSTYENFKGIEPSLTYSLKTNERIYTAVDENGEWYSEGRNHINAYYVLEIENTCHWSQKVSFCCEDVGEETMVAMRVIDWHGNHNECMVNVRVLDFLPPYIECPDDVVANCDENFNPDDLSQFGSAEALDDCGTVTISESSVIDSRDCGEYYIRRTFTATDAGGNRSNCLQIIELENETPFTFTEIEWPSDTTLVDIACHLADIDSEITGEPTWDDSRFPCSNITYTHDDLLFYIADGVCQKLIRTWTVIDWCQPDRLWEYNQVIKLINTVEPEIDPASCANYTYNDGIVLGNCLVRIDDLTANLVENELNCGQNPLWQYTIDLHDDGSIDLTGFGDDASGDYPYGDHRITWQVTDDCKNTSTCDKIFTIIDHVPPTPYCHGEIVIPISHPDGIEVWASDLNLGSFDDCVNNTVYFSFEENVMVPNMSFDCSVFDSTSNEASLTIDLWVWDSPNSITANKSSCTVTLTIQDNADVCDDNAGSPVANIRGSVYTEDIAMVHNVEMHLVSSNEDQGMMSTDGEFAFNSIAMYDDYRIEASKNDGFLNGVSTLDLILIQRHILGLERLDSPYKIIAADIDNSHSITAHDLIELRKLILGIYEEFPDNKSWRFVEEAFKFLDAEHPFPFSENVLLENLDRNINNADFIAVKIGDVNKNVITNLNGSPSIDSRSVDQMYTIDLVSHTTDKGNTRFQLVATEDIDLAGIQFDLNFAVAKTQLLAAVPMEIQFGNDNISWDKLNEGLIKMSWDNPEGIDIEEGQVLMEFLMQGHQANLELSLDSDLTAELYEMESNTITDRPIVIRPRSNSSYQFLVGQNVPNPFKDETTIDFTLDKSGKVRFSVTDQTGRLLYSEEYELDAGPNKILFDSNDINATGLLYYQISTETHTATRKMIVIQ